MGNKTPLYSAYKEYGGKTIDFGGWDLPVQFSSIKEEHRTVRERAGLFDVSHMGQIKVTGKNTIPFLQKMLTNDLEKAKPGQCQYTAMCYEDGGTVDDLVLYKFSDSEVLLVVNAANIEKDFDWLYSHIEENVTVANVSEGFALLAVQGPEAEKIAQRMTEVPLQNITYFRFQNNVKFAGENVLISRTGYTGEDGFEIYCAPESAMPLWKKIIEEGAEPIGLGARDTLRFEARLALYGQELSKDITPIEAGIGFAVKPDKGVDFIGRDTLKKQKEEGPGRKIVGLEMIDKGIPRSGYKVYDGEKEIGFVTSGTQSPTLGKNVGLAVVNREYTNLDSEISVQIRKKLLKAKVVKTPFYVRKKS
ncbi:glycine cleavage system aminomethyltransferase GcvT [Alkalicoccus halolimnae]|uniref:Aminomethyltransferase n=1 Tax=Alkalicoccus halolimnae TaxID=1667239 RepID=A0A5C7FA16_9BACI|nr:glycine cleavage system aminomethyltransferase GcvT [Alkalicoccus halolimnae]TXF86380.1 glycine cleavage system aminomethyltransferase GcvT [Alkalicoccus halolimnae]